MSALVYRTSQHISNTESFISQDLFERLEQENARLPPQESTAFILARIERQNALLEKDPKSICIHSNELKAHFSTVQRLLQDNEDFELWQALIENSDQVMLVLPHLLSIKLAGGIPESVRGLIWQTLSKSASLHLETVYEQLCREKSPHERIIQRDLARTFPRIEMFKKENGKGQVALKKILEAYSLYDAEVGYCQGLAFLVGPLLMNMPESQSFCVFVRLMETYEMRSMFTLHMEGLQLRLYQFSQLFSDILPDLFAHFESYGVHPAMYASQWFLTLFAYAFPMPLVSRIYDIVFAEGAAETIMRVSIALLKKSKETLMNMKEFEDLLDFVTTGKLCLPYTDYTHIIKDAMALSPQITKEKLDTLKAVPKTKTRRFWARKKGPKKLLVKSAIKPPVKMAPKRTSLDVDEACVTRNSTSSVCSLPLTPKSLEEYEGKIRLDRALDEICELRYDKEDLICERDALKLTILELERCSQQKLEDKCASLNEDLSHMQSKLDMVSDGQMALIDKLLQAQIDMETILEIKNSNEAALQKALEDNDILKKQLKHTQNMLAYFQSDYHHSAELDQNILRKVSSFDLQHRHSLPTLNSSVRKEQVSLHQSEEKQPKPKKASSTSFYDKFLFAIKTKPQ
ncbi:rab-GTPase-TBC domain-containing protein [Sporodiniella umbellata]|nr:rab-GTPase-TBC domain-containing protein [Sporodiniella umbellata]